MNESTTFEYVVAEIPTGRRKALKFLGRFGIIALLAAFALACVGMNIPQFIVIPIAFLGVFLYFWKLFDLELEYSMTSGVMTFSRIWGSRRRKGVLSLIIKDFREVAPVDPETPARLRARGVEKTYLFASSMKAEDLYVAVFDDGGTPAAVYFEATERALKILRYYNPGTVLKSVRR